MTPEGLEVRRLIYEHEKKAEFHAMQLNAEYGKWLIASLLLLHGAALAFLAQNDRLAAEVLPHVFWWFVIGLLAALVCGFMVWINWTLHAVVHGTATAHMIYDDAYWPKFEGKAYDWIAPTHWLAIGFGLVSAGCLLGAAITMAPV